MITEFAQKQRQAGRIGILGFVAGA